MKRVIVFILLAVLAVGSLVSCEECEHTWSEATCASLGRCSECGAVRGGLSEVHNYADGICIYCGNVSPETLEVIQGFIAQDFVEMWLETYNENEPMMEPVEIEAQIKNLDYSQGKILVQATVFLRMQSMGFFMSDVEAFFERSSDGYVISEREEVKYSVAVELDPLKKYAIYHFDEAVTMVYNTGNGEEREELCFENGDVERISYDADGNLVSSAKMHYIMRRTPEYSIVIISDEVYEYKLIFINGKEIRDGEKVYTTKSVVSE